METAVKELQVEAECNLIASGLDMLEQTVNKLAQRLSSVLCEEKCEEESGEAVIEKAPLAATMSCYDYRIRGVDARVTSIIDRLEL